ncbi:MAG: FAD:protein FMN transferase [Bacteroidales bacterium]|nr:FAD:protein FMN transferase [Bacteroidales bacterium]
MSKRILAVLFLLLLIVGTVFVLSSSQFYKTEGHIFGTSYHVEYSSKHNLDREILAELQRVDSALSMFKEQSTLSRFNNNLPYAPNEMFDETMKMALHISKETEGAFDITVAPLVNAWGFGFKNRDDVTQTMVDSLLQFVGYQKLQLVGKQYRKDDSRLSVDMGAIAKGYGVDRVARLLAAKGCKNYIVEVGGEVVARGLNAKGEKWTLGINQPIEDSTQTQQSLQAIVRLTDCGVATSGNYRNFYYKGGRKYAHTIHPHTGYPVEHSLLSATVIAPTCAQADAYATSFMVMGLDKAKQFVQKHPKIDAYLIYADDKGQLQTWTSKRMKHYLENQ